LSFAALAFIRRSTALSGTDRNNSLRIFFARPLAVFVLMMITNAGHHDRAQTLGERRSRLVWFFKRHWLISDRNDRPLFFSWICSSAR